MGQHAVVGQREGLSAEAVHLGAFGLVDPLQIGLTAAEEGVEFVLLHGADVHIPVCGESLVVFVGVDFGGGVADSEYACFCIAGSPEEAISVVGAWVELSVEYELFCGVVVGGFVEEEAVGFEAFGE